MVTLHKCCKSRSLWLCSYDYRKEEKSKAKGGQGKVGQFLEFKFNRIVLSFLKTPMCVLKIECRVVEQNQVEITPTLHMWLQAPCIRRPRILWAGSHSGPHAQLSFSPYIPLPVIWVDSVWECLLWLLSYFCRNIVFHITLCSHKTRLMEGLPDHFTGQ